MVELELLSYINKPHEQQDYIFDIVKYSLPTPKNTMSSNPFLQTVKEISNGKVTFSQVD